MGQEVGVEVVAALEDLEDLEEALVVEQVGLEDLEVGLEDLEEARALAVGVEAVNRSCLGGGWWLV